MKKTSPHPSETQNFHWHCEVAALLLKSFPLEPAVRSNLAHAIRLGTLCCTGKNGIRYATRRAYEKQRASGGDWYKLGLIREHVFPVGLVVSRVVNDAVSPPSEQRSELLEHLVPEDLMRWPLIRGQLVDGAAAIAALLRKHSLIAWATEEDDKELKAKGLAKKMPPMPGGFDPFARYRHCGIEWIDLHQATGAA